MRKKKRNIRQFSECGSKPNQIMRNIFKIVLNYNIKYQEIRKYNDMDKT